MDKENILLKAKKILNENKTYLIDNENLSKLLKYKEIILDKMLYKNLYLRYSKENKIVSLLHELEKEIENKNLIILQELIDKIIIAKSSIEDGEIGCLIKINDNSIIPYLESKSKKLGFSINNKGEIIEIIGLGSYGIFYDDDNNKNKMFVIKYIEKGIYDENDVKIDLFHSDGAGGQNVNKVESGVRATHLLTNIVVTCKDERSQLFNKQRALDKLKEKVEECYQKEFDNYIKSEIKKVYGKKI